MKRDTLVKSVGWARVRDEAEPFQPSPTGEIRQGGLVMLLICVALLAVGRFLIWHGAATPQIMATLLFFLVIYTLFALAQTIFGVSFNEYYQNFWRLSAKQKWVYLVMIVMVLGLLWPLSHSLFPGIENKIHR